MITYRFSREDLLRTRFAISPLMELSGAFDALRRPADNPVHEPWAVRARKVTAPLELSLLDVVVPLGATFYPDFATPPPEVPAAQLEGELERVRRTPPAQVARELRQAYPDGLPQEARVLIDRPQAGLDRLVAEMRAFYDAAVAPHWDAILAALEAEVAWRARRLAAVGPQAAFAGISDQVRWHEDRVEVTGRLRDRAIDLGGRGLLLVPAVFAGPTVWPMSDPPWQPSIVYEPAGVGDVWEPPAPVAEALAGLLGHGRARVLLTLDHPAATTPLARRLGASPSTISEHLTALRRAGLVVGRREGRLVLYGRTALGDALVRADSAG